ncbi:hypothetical protein GCM10015535_66610 [Streptomyces gelaticus]|uniref:Uncharacterized protein n=1 Tax=Streptomyces gelaticus TaxID=285446 RepID=A0ABQ2W8F7_9ACTN|nr:hypothetical protein GCM10015535_66610 [Streptomyces gelaticus]
MGGHRCQGGCMDDLVSRPAPRHVYGTDHDDPHPSGNDERDLIPLSVPEIRRLIGHVVIAPHCHPNEHRLRWSHFRRRSQARARRCHYQRRGHDPHMRLQY